MLADFLVGILSQFIQSLKNALHYKEDQEATTYNYFVPNFSFEDASLLRIAVLQNPECF